MGSAVVVATLTLMTWNVQNLFPPGVADGGPRTEEEFEEKIASLAAVIRSIGPNVLCLQEVGVGDVLGPLRAAVGGLDHELTGIPDGRGIRVAVLADRPLLHPHDIRLLPAGVLPVQVRDPVEDRDDVEVTTSELGRPALEATVDVDGSPVTVVNAHLKSKLLTYPRGPGQPGSPFAPLDEDERARYSGYALFRRTTEAMAVRTRVNELLAVAGSPRDGTGRDRVVVVCGDLNDEELAATTQILSAPPGSEIDLRPGSGFGTPDRGDGLRLWNLAPLIPTERRFSRVYRGQAELIDHLLATHRLVNPSRLPTVDTAGPEPLPSIGDDPTAMAGHPGSDHAAVWARFEV
jgi:endonuclease/exonuclease/phosphatase family metal-dependent hydrolase